MAIPNLDHLATDLEGLHQKLDQLIRAEWARLNDPIFKGDAKDFIEEMLASTRESNQEKKLPYLDLWIGIYDHLIYWMSLLSILAEAIFFSTPRPDNFSKAIFALACRLVSDLIAVRHLILLGHDTAATVLTRSLCEHIDLITAMYLDPSLAEPFLLADTPNKSNEFWHRHLSKKKLDRRLEAAWVNFLKRHSPTDEVIDNGASDWVRSDQRILDGFTHPSFLPSFFAALPFSTAHEEPAIPSYFGNRTDGSVMTLRVICTRLFEFFVLTDSNKLINISLENLTESDASHIERLSRGLMHGRTVLIDVLFKAFAANRDAFSRKFDYSIFNQSISTSGNG